jgi:hypothetical protein
MEHRIHLILLSAQSCSKDSVLYMAIILQMNNDFYSIDFLFNHYTNASIIGIRSFQSVHYLHSFTLKGMRVSELLVHCCESLQFFSTRIYSMRANL